MPHKVLIVACHEESRQSAYILTEVLESSGYSCENTHVDTEGESQVKVDRIMEPEMSISDFMGVVFFDDGGNEEIAEGIAKKALDKEIVLGGFSVRGCNVLHNAGALKGAYVCGGLPDEFYSKAKERVESPSVRSDKIITGTGDCAGGFGIVLIDALGGKVKRIIRSNEMDEYIKLTQPVAPKDAPRAKVAMRSGAGGWRVTASSVKPSDSPKAYMAALHAVVVAQSICEDPDDITDATVSVAFGDEGPSVEYVETNQEQESASRKNRQRMAIQLERELANEGVFLQPEGTVHIVCHPSGKTFSPDDAVEELRKRTIEAIEEEISENKAGRADAWTSLCARRHRHVLRCLIGLLTLMGHRPKYVFAAQSIGGPNFGTAVSDMDMRARVWPYFEDEGWMEDRQKYIEDLPRYNPEYVSESQSNPNAYGVYYVWDEVRRPPYLWKDRMTEGPYPFNDALKP